MRTRQSPSRPRGLITLHQHPHFAVVQMVLKALIEQGYRSVLAGGCVRDAILGLPPKDLDVATAAPPEVVERTFERTLAVGKAFGTIVVVEQGCSVEVTTFRKDGPYLDGRHPQYVEFSDIEEDAKRRDFTVNALFYDPFACEVLDFVDGVDDIHSGLLRTVGKAEDRFKEDSLRLMRAVRFVAQLGFTLDPTTLRAMQQQFESIAHVSMERIFNELRATLARPFVSQGLYVMRASHLSEVLWPELSQANLDRFRDFTPLLNWENGFSAVMLLAGAVTSEERLRQWKAPGESQRRVSAQMEGCKTLMNPSSSRADRARVLGGEHFAEVLNLARGFLHENIPIIEGWIEEFLKVTGTSAVLPKPILTGQDLLAIGIPPGEKMGLLLKALYEQQLEGCLGPKLEVLRQLKDYQAN